MTSEKETVTIEILVIGAFLILLPMLSVRFWAWRVPWRVMMGMAGYGWLFMLVMSLLLFVLISVGAYLLLYGYYTIHADRGGRIYGMLSVIAYTGDVWYTAGMENTSRPKR